MHHARLRGSSSRSSRTMCVVCCERLARRAEPRAGGVLGKTLRREEINVLVLLIACDEFSEEGIRFLPLAIDSSESNEIIGTVLGSVAIRRTRGRLCPALQRPPTSVALTQVCAPHVGFGIASECANCAKRVAAAAGVKAAVPEALDV
eukprot:3566473-Prymnesium_polylepis.2